jgi:hypothetical protein
MNKNSLDTYQLEHFDLSFVLDFCLMNTEVCLSTDADSIEPLRFYSKTPMRLRAVGLSNIHLNYTNTHSIRGCFHSNRQANVTVKTFIEAKQKRRQTRKCCLCGSVIEISRLEHFFSFHTVVVYVCFHGARAQIFRSFADAFERRLTLATLSLSLAHSHRDSDELHNYIFVYRPGNN